MIDSYRQMIRPITFQGMFLKIDFFEQIPEAPFQIVFGNKRVELVLTTRGCLVQWFPVEELSPSKGHKINLRASEMISWDELESKAELSSETESCFQFTLVFSPL